MIVVEDHEQSRKLPESELNLRGSVTMPGERNENN